MKISLILLLLLGLNTYAQKYITKTGNTEFKASVAAFEAVEAKNESTTAIINSENGQIAALLFIKAFHFKVALMQEHFNENYMESDIYPKASFKGQISNFNINHFSEIKTELPLKGFLTVRGVQKQIDTKIYIQKKNDQLIAVSNFSVKPEEFNIKIPRIVSKKISETINITFNYELTKK